MKRYLTLYYHYARMSLMTLLVHRSNFINNLISSLSWGVFLFLSMYLLTSQSTMVYGWKRAELLFATSGYSIMIGIFHTLFSKNFETLSQRIRYGELDALLVKPIDTQFLVSLGYVNYTSIIRIILGLGFSVFFLNELHGEIKLPFLVFAVFLLGFGIILLYSLWFIVATLLIYFPRAGNIIQLMYSITGFSRYPKEMYQRLGEAAFSLFFLLTLILLVPVRTFLRQASIMDAGILVLCSCGVCLLSRIWWKHSLAFYASASS